MFKQLMEKILCKHKWEVFNTTNTFGRFPNLNDRPIEITKTLICEECGKIKKINM